VDDDKGAASLKRSAKIANETVETFKFLELYCIRGA